MLIRLKGKATRMSHGSWGFAVVVPGFSLKHCLH